MTGKRMLLLGCGVASLCAGGPAMGQAFNANPATVAGGVAYDRATPGVETIFVFSDSAIINWTPNAGVFLPAGNVATFQNGPNNPTFAVLNRIMTSTPVRFDGTVLGRLQQAGSGVPLERGGTIVFQTPGGMIIGPTALFDVGSLVLTTLNVFDDGGPNFGGQTGSYELAAVGGVAPASIVIEPGARITALNQGSYVAMVAPSITQGGLVRVNGSIAYVAGEQVVLKVNNGLFDIVVTTGTDSVTGIVHTGNSGGPSSGAADDVHRIYMVAMPKNQALTAVLEGSVGFDPAVVATVENGAIVLSAGFNVVGGNVERFATLAPVPPGANASFHVRGGTLSSDLFGFAAVDMFASGQTTGALNALQDVSLTAHGRARLFAGSGQTVRVLGNVLVSAAQPGLPVGGAVDLVGGEAMIFASGGGNVIVNGTARVDASAVGGSSLALGLLGTGTGGNAAIFGDAGSVRIAGDVLVLAGGVGAQPPVLPDQGTAGFGGAARVEALNGGTVVLGGSLGLDASGAGGASNGLAPAIGAVGTGGNVRLAASDSGSVTVAGGANIAAGGSGGAVLGGPGNVGGFGQGGAVVVVANGGTIDLAGTTAMSADGNGGAGPRGGDGQGGSVSLDALNGQLLFGGAMGFTALGRGGASATGGGEGGDGFGGEIVVTARAGGGGARIAGGSIEVDASGFGGAGGNGSAGVAAGDGGDGQGGAVVLLAEAGNGTIEFDAASVTANGAGGGGGAIDNNVDGGSGGDGRGGQIEIGTAAVFAGGAGTGSVRLAQLDARATGLGGDGGLGAGGGGAASGGGVTILAASAPVTIAGAVTLEADGRAGAGGGTPGGGGGSGAGGQASGGRLRLDASGAGGSLTAPDLVGTASALGAATAANLPGEWHIIAGPGGTIDLANLTLTADANGIPGTPAFSSLEPLGGTITVTQLATLMARGEIRIVGADAGRALGGRYVFTAGTDLTASHVNPGGATVDVTDLALTAGRDFRGNPGSLLRAANRLDLNATGAAFLDGGLLGREIRIGADSIAMQPGGRVGDGATERVEMTATGNAQLAGSVVGGDILITAAAINVVGLGTVGDANTLETELRATGALALAGTVRGRTILAQGGTIGVAAAGTVGDANTLQTELRATGGVAIAGTVRGRTILAEGGTIGVSATGIVGGPGTDQATLRTPGTITVAGRVLGRSLLLGSSDLDIQTGAAVGDGATERVEMTATGNAQLAGSVVGQDILITAAAINVAGGATVGDANTLEAELRATGALAIAGTVRGRTILAQGGTIGVAAAGTVGDANTLQTELRATGGVAIAGTVRGRTILAEGGTIGVSATGIVGGPGTDQATLRTPGTITVAGRVLGRSLLLGSSDLDIQTGAAVGDGATELVTLEITAPVLQGVAQPTVIGGTAPGTGYTLANAEAGRIRAGTLRIVAPGFGNAVAVLIRDLALNGGGAAAGVGRFELVTPGVARIEGNVLMANARAGDGISLSIAERLELVTPTASLRVRAAGGAPGGTLSIDSRNIWIATQPILDRLRIDPFYPGRDDDLLDNGGVDAPRGFVEADAITLTAGNSLFVQNSGPAFSRAFAGITSGPGGLVIRAAGTTPATVTAFGRRLNADGSFTVGDEWFFLVDYQVGGPAGGGAGFSAASTFNTCIIVTGQCPARAPGNPVPGPDPTTGPTGGSDSILLPPGTEEDDLVDTSFSAEGLIEEPVTSGGESSLWEPDCERDENGRCVGVEP